MKKIDQLMQERHSARDFDPQYQIPSADLEAILNAIRLSPSSYNLLNYRVLVMPKSKFRDQLDSIFNHQKNFFNSSIYLLFVAKNGESLKNQSIYEVSDLLFPTPDLTGQKTRFIGNFHRAYEQRVGNQPLLGDAMSAEQVYIGVGVATVAAASLNIDSCIQRGINWTQLNEFLAKKKLIGNDESAILGLALGKANDQNSVHPKVRKSYAEFVKVVE